MSEDKMIIEKGTHVELFQPVVKGEDGKYVAILSSDAPDRDNDIVSAACQKKMAKDEDYLVILADHVNSIENQIGEWTNKRVVNRNGNMAFVAEPKFYLSNPKAQYIKSMLDEGAKMGISIGAIINEYTKIEDKDGKFVGYQYDDVELLEASFVAIPSNRHGRAMAVAKMLKSKSEDKKMGNPEDLMYSQKDFDSELAKAVEKKLSEKTKELEDFKVESEKSLTDAVTKAVADEVKKTEAKETELADAVEKNKELEALKVFKAKHEGDFKNKKVDSGEERAKKEKEYKEDKKVPSYTFEEEGE